jgi:hypothetical protein
MASNDGDDTRPTLGLRLAWLALGHAAVALGAVGMFVPLLPTVALWILAAWAYARASPELRHRLQTHPRFGPSIVAWQQHGVIPRRAKVAALVAMAASWGITYATGAAAWVLVLVAAVLLTVGAYIATRPERAG